MIEVHEFRNFETGLSITLDNASDKKYRQPFKNSEEHYKNHFYIVSMNQQPNMTTSASCASPRSLLVGKWTSQNDLVVQRPTNHKRTTKQRTTKSEASVACGVESAVIRAGPFDFDPPPPPPPSTETPLRFLRAGKNDAAEGRRRYEMTLAWRRKVGMDYQIRSPNPKFELIKRHYPQYYHLRGRNNEPVWYERPAGVNLKALREEAKVTVDELLLHYATMTEFGWQCLEQDDFAQSITVIDMEGVRLKDFVGEVVDFTRKCSASTGDHYPERAGHVIIANVPSWFKCEHRQNIASLIHLLLQ